MNSHRETTITQFIEEHAKRVNAELERILNSSDHDIPASLRESILYSLTAGGKRLRPVLLFSAVEALGGDISQAMPIALATEMIHTYSLIHDDLPAMDNDDFRRGKPTNHKMFGEAMAILAGDALLTHAFYMITRAKDKTQIPPEVLLKIIEELSYYAGPYGMVGGQAADMESEQGTTTLEQLEYIYQHKTGDLIAFSLRAGGYVAGASDAQLEALGQFGHFIGFAFQIQDDILDIIGDENKLGKTTHSDERAEKVTYPYFIGVEGSKAKIAELTNRGKEIILAADFPYPDRLLQLADFLMGRDH